MGETIWVAVIGIIGGGGFATALIGLWKDRKKDEATAKLTDVEALQKQVVLLTTITDYLRKENAQLQADLDEESERSRRFRTRLMEMEEELDSVQKQCKELSAKLRSLLTPGEN